MEWKHLYAIGPEQGCEGTVLGGGVTGARVQQGAGFLLDDSLGPDAVATDQDDLGINGLKK